ncbi:MAG: TldD/PmbA family protein [Bacillota bacterium]
MVGEARALELLERVLKLSPGDQTQAGLTGARSYLTRFATNYIHQNVAESNASLSVEVIFGKKIGAASTNDLSEAGLERVVRQATDLARMQKENPEFVSLPAPQPIPKLDCTVRATAEFTPEDRAAGVKRLVDLAKQHGLEASGAFSTETREVAVVSSLGIRAYDESNLASLSTVVMSDAGAGWAGQDARDVRAIDPARIAQTAVQKCLDSGAPQRLDAGEYEVVLEPAAVGTMLVYLGMLGFGALGYQEGRSFLSGKLGQPIFGPNIDLWDDGLDQAGLAVPFDAEGIPKRKLPLVEGGVARNVCYDSYTANKEPGKSSTGHSTGSRSFGPVPMNVFMRAGDATLEQMIASTERGILVTRFHYVNPVHPVKAIITGMTRDGTFLIEGGRVKHAVKNLRFTQSIIEALQRVELIGRERRVQRGWVGGVCVPALKVRGFNFTGVTEH